jgi:hypothetical protein
MKPVTRPLLTLVERPSVRTDSNEVSAKRTRGAAAKWSAAAMQHHCRSCC